MRKAKILITGASGCVGQYIASWLLNNSDAELFLWLRDPQKLKSIDHKDPRVHLLIGDLRDTNLFANELSKITRFIHTATAWGDPKRAFEVNIVALKNLLSLLDPNVIEQIIYFSTASILNQNLRPLNEAFEYGTEYIQTKAICFKELQKHEYSGKIVAIFPTLVFGGRVDHKSPFPTSYLTQGLLDATKWLWLARWFKVFSNFHFIHAADIAFICGHLAINPHPISQDKDKQSIKKLVLGQPGLSVDHAISTLLKWKGMKKTPRLPLWGWLLEFLVKVLPIEINEWDRYSIRQRHFTYSKITNPESFGATSYAKTITEVLINSGVSKGKKTKRS